MRKRVVVSCGVGDRYEPYLARLKDTVKRFSSIPIFSWSEDWPIGSPTHRAMHYAFKIHAVKYAKESGYDSVLWLDAASYATGPIEPVFERIERDGYFLSTGVDILGQWISDRALSHYGFTRDQAMHWKLPAGCIVGLDFQHVLGRAFFWEWFEASKTGLFWSFHSEHAPDRMTSLYSDGPTKEAISSDPRCLGHRSDEACFGLMMKCFGMKPTPIGDLFEGGLAKTVNGCIRSGYDL